jgi:large conductance mechanosensitive channel
MGLVSEFKAFIVKGNAIDLAVGIIIGAAFGVVVKSLVDDVLMPPIGALLGGVDFSNLAVTIQGPKEAGETLLNGMTAKAKMEPVVLKYGKLINAFIQLLIQGFCVFLLVKAINKLKRKEAIAPTTPPVPNKEEMLLTDIRDILARQAK